MGLRSDQRTDQRSVGVPVNNKEFRLRNSRAERGRFSDKFLLCASAHLAERYFLSHSSLHIFQRMNSSRCPVGFHGTGSGRAGKPRTLVNLPSVRNSPKEACRKRIARSGRIQTYLHRNRRDCPSSLPVRQNTSVGPAFDNRCLYSA